ncbi:MAG: SulP family inorganic anion transporter, partial [Bosea sp. (in: a-proteobacteria)]
LILLAFMLVAAPLAFHIPLAALAGLLTVICWNMIERDNIRHILAHSRSQTAVMLLTFGLVLFVDLLVGIAAGVALSLMLARFAAPENHA